MPRTSNNPRIVNRTVRAKLVERRDPYWHLIAEGQHIGYRKGAHGGTWIARIYDSANGRRFQSLGAADDVIDADGRNVFSFQQAQDSARIWFAQLAHIDAGEVIAGPYTVKQAMADYLADRERLRRKKLPRTRSVIDTHINPSLGHIELSKLTYGKVKTWRDTVAETSPRVRNKPNATEQAYRDIDTNDPDAIRKRQATANRIFTVLRAALNHAYKERKVATKASWEKVTAFREVDVPKVRYLTVPECKRLIEACPEDFRALVRAALYTGARYGELSALRVDAFNPVAGTIQIERSKNGKGRYIPLTEEGAAFFASVTAERLGAETMFTHADGPRKDAAWEHSQQRYWIQSACTEAKIFPEIGFHILRHTYASQLAMNGTPMPVIAALLGHSDTRMTEKHYAHLAPSHIADTLRANLPSFGFTAPPAPSGEPTHAEVASGRRTGRLLSISEGSRAS